MELSFPPRFRGSSVGSRATSSRFAPCTASRRVNRDAPKRAKRLTTKSLQSAVPHRRRSCASAGEIELGNGSSDILAAKLPLRSGSLKFLPVVRQTMSSPTQTTRRSFLRVASAVGVSASVLPYIVPASALGRDGAVAPSDKITLGVIGIGPRCTYDLTAMLRFWTCIARRSPMCRRAAATPARNWLTCTTETRLQVYRDFRDLLARRDVDAVLIATGDRWHAPASILAARRARMFTAKSRVA